MMLQLLVTTLLASTITPTYSNYFYLPARFQDNPRISRKLIIDITDANSYVFDTNSFPELALNASIDFSKSCSYNETKDKFGIYIDTTFNDRSAVLTGPIATEHFDLGFAKFEHTFGAVTGGQPEVLDLPNGDVAVGRLGFTNVRSIRPIELRDKIMEGFSSKNLCLGTAISPSGKRRATHIGLGKVIFPQGNHIVTTKTETSYVAGLWKVLVGGIWSEELGVQDVGSITFTTTFDGISIPIDRLDFIENSLKATRKHGRFFADCEGRSIVFRTNEQTILIKRSTFAVPIGNGQCELKLRIHSDRFTVYLGLPFFINHGVCADFATQEVSVYDLSLKDDEVMMGQTMNVTKDGVEFVTYSEL